MSTSHSLAADKFLANRKYAAWHDTTFWSVRTKRDNMAMGLDEWEQLREKASQIKRHTVTHLDEYLEQFAENAEKNGCIVHWAGNASDFNEIVLGILCEHRVRKLVKSKSMLTEECDMNQYLEMHGIEVVETDLGERIIQLKGQKPSHIVMPAIHLNHDDVGELFEEKLATERGNHDPAYLTYMARLSLRNEFLTAEAGMTGANFGVAETGDIVVCTNEGNADMSTSCPKLHIAVIGLEKIVPNYDSLAVFQRMLCRAATGQPTTTYTSHFRKARPTAEKMHIILVDNGRSEWIADPEHWEILKCIRCGSCMNTCPVYRHSGGYSYSYFIPGPVGVNLGMLRNKQLHSGNVSACTLCLSCQTVCPVKIDLGDQIYKWRQHLDEYGTANNQKKIMCKAMSFLYGNTWLYNTALKFAPVANYVPAFLMECSLNPWAKGHKMMTFPKKSFHDMFKSGMLK
ncbi:lactate utilization protein B [Prevotella sp. OH937_COT-195]|uniref:lactate utilization protein B n=1 Tax=Prevotella sp. OH937_COT-195 TaxID=2491051 RepID=UPI000F6477E5|nr:lactate utilization protein B [Prevotella sp. OH937_COT-195]RRD02382.1 lactate utilization protein [Prevotella sp. OH937_COT-195]